MAVEPAVERPLPVEDSLVLPASEPLADVPSIADASCCVACISITTSSIEPSFSPLRP